MTMQGHDKAWCAGRRIRQGLNGFLICAAAVLSTACGGGGPGNGNPVPLGQAQIITFGEAPTLGAGGSATVQATASSGLAVSFASTTPSICTVDAVSGVVQGLSVGNCVVTADQAGNAVWASAAKAFQTIIVSGGQPQTLSFESAPVAAVHDVVTVKALSSAGLPVTYSSLTSTICSINETSGALIVLAPGTCTVVAHQAGNGSYAAAVQVTQDLVVAPASGSPSVPGIPQGVMVSAGETIGQVRVSARGVQANGSAITQYTVSSSPAGITVAGPSLPVTVNCPGGSCAGYAFELAASNSQGSSEASAPMDLLVPYDVVLVFEEPDYTYINTEFRGRFLFNASQRTVSGLKGDLSEVMAGNNQPALPWPSGMPLLPLQHQLVTQPVEGGLLVGTFLLNSTLTLSEDPRDGGVSNGWQPGRGNYKYHGYANGERLSANRGNAYALIFVNTTDPMVPLTPEQIDWLAYADCAEQGMMGDDCMTGTTVKGYGVIGSMGGYPVSQTITRAVP